MKRAKSILCSFVLALPLFLPAFAAHAESRDRFVQQYTQGPVNSRVLMLIPDDFDRNASRPMSSELGQRAVGLLDIALRSEFESLGIGRTASASDALARLAARDADFSRFDLIAIPRFEHVSYWTNGWGYGYGYQFDINLVVDFYRNDGTKVTSIRGHGETTTGAYSGTPPGESGDRALRMAIAGVRDGVIRWNEGRI